MGAVDLFLGELYQVLSLYHGIRCISHLLTTLFLYFPEHLLTLPSFCSGGGPGDETVEMVRQDVLQWSGGKCGSREGQGGGGKAEAAELEREGSPLPHPFLLLSPSFLFSRPK